MTCSNPVTYTCTGRAAACASNPVDKLTGFVRVGPSQLGLLPRKRQNDGLVYWTGMIQSSRKGFVREECVRRGGTFRFGRTIRLKVSK